MKKVSVVGILIVENKVLLLKRHSYDRTLPNVLCLPGGKVEGDEKFRDALEREFLKETNILVHCHPELMEQISKKENDKFIIYFYTVFSIVQPINIIISDEHESYHWIDLDHLILYKDEIAPLTYEVLESIK